MTEFEIMRVRMLMAEARATSANRHADFMSKYSDIAMSLVEFWRGHAPPGTELPADLAERIEKFRAEAE